MEHRTNARFIQAIDAPAVCLLRRADAIEMCLHRRQRDKGAMSGHALIDRRWTCTSVAASSQSSSGQYCWDVSSTQKMPSSRKAGSMRLRIRMAPSAMTYPSSCPRSSQLRVGGRVTMSSYAFVPSWDVAK